MTHNRSVGLIITMAFVTIMNGCIPTKTPSISLPSATATLEETNSLSTLLTRTFTSVPTLSSDEAYTYVDVLLSDDSDCRLPCWLGIMPAQSTLVDIQSQLTMLSSISIDPHFGLRSGEWSVAGLTIPFLENDTVLEVFSAYLTYVGENDVSVITFHTRAYATENGEFINEVYGNPAYSNLLQNYTLSGILYNYGLPIKIFIEAYLRGDTTVTPSYGDLFMIHLWYPDQGIFMEYKMSVEGSGNNYRFCPSSAFISGYLMSPGLGEGYQDVLLKLGDRYQGFFPPSLYVKTPEEAFGMTNEEFYELFDAPTDLCLDSPKSIWWP